MKLDESTELKIQEIQLFEQQLQGFLMEKQVIQGEYNEVNNALDEIKKTDDEVYKVLGGIMIKANKKTLSEELQERKKIAEVRINALEKQEKLVQNKILVLRDEINAVLTKK